MSGGGCGLRALVHLGDVRGTRGVCVISVTTALRFVSLQPPLPAPRQWSVFLQTAEASALVYQCRVGDLLLDGMIDVR